MPYQTSSLEVIINVHMNSQVVNEHKVFPIISEQIRLDRVFRIGSLALPLPDANINKSVFFQCFELTIKRLIQY